MRVSRPSVNSFAAGRGDRVADLADPTDHRKLPSSVLAIGIDRFYPPAGGLFLDFAQRIVALGLEDQISVSVARKPKSGS
jgi:hypothetical protein